MRSHWVWLISPLHHFTITPFKYTFYIVVWVQAMLIVFNEFGISTYVLTEKRWICGFHDSRTNNTLITSIYLCCVDTRKQLYTSNLGCYRCACVRPCRWILVSVTSKQFIRPTCWKGWPPRYIMLSVIRWDAARDRHWAIAWRPP